MTRGDDAPAMTVKGRIIALCVGLVLMVAAAEAVARIVMPQWRDFYSGRFIRTEDVPGYGRVAIGVAGFDGTFAQNNGDFNVRIRINDFGLREEDPPAATDGRVWVVGDSMAFGWGVEANERYSAVLAELSGIPTYNIASPGADICGYQALLARMPKALQPRSVLMGLILENDIAAYDCQAAARTVEEAPSREEQNVLNWARVKGLGIRYSALYNFIAVGLKRVDAAAEVFRFLGLIEDTHVYRRQLSAEKMATAVRATVDEIARFRDMLPPGTFFAVLIAPSRFEIRDGDAFEREMRERVRGALKEHGIDSVDPFPAFREKGLRATHFAHDGHWGTLGHRLAAEAAAVWLKTAVAP